MSSGLGSIIKVCCSTISRPTTIVRFSTRWIFASIIPMEVQQPTAPLRHNPLHRPRIMLTSTLFAADGTDHSTADNPAMINRHRPPQNSPTEKLVPHHTPKVLTPAPINANCLFVRFPIPNPSLLLSSQVAYGPGWSQ